MPDPIQWIFFDVGYTLLDETPAWRDRFEAMAAFLARNGWNVAADAIFTRYEQCCAAFAPTQWKAVVSAYLTDPQGVADYMATCKPWRHDLERPYPGVKAMLAELSEHFRLGIIANQSLGTRERMARHGLLEHLSLVVGSAEAGVVKPDPWIFELALREAGCEAPQAVMVGDRLDNDIRPANLLGMKTIHVRQGGSGAQRPRDASDLPGAVVDAVGSITRELVRSLP